MSVAAQRVLEAKKTVKIPCVAIIYYSMYGHVLTLAQEAKAGLEAAGVSVDLLQVPETLSREVLVKMSAPEKLNNIMTIDQSFFETLPQYDGIMFGMSTRFGMMPHQMKSFFDGTGGLWQKGALVGKLAATFVSTGTQNGGQETTHLTSITQLVHHGMMYVPLGYQASAIGQFDLKEVHGGSPYGASCLAGPDGSRKPSTMELAIAKEQGRLFGSTVKRSLAPPPSRSPKVCIVYYSMYGHVKCLTDEITTALKKSGVQVDVFQAPELLPPEVLTKMGAPQKPADPVMDHSTVGRLPEYDGFVFGIPTRFGCIVAQMKAFFDSTGSLWQNGALAGKLAATFVSTGTANGGSETTHITVLPNIVHHGMIFVPLGYAAGAEGQFAMDEVHGGSPWGASTIAGADGRRQPSQVELNIAAKQGVSFAARIKQMASK
jgi:NAD(P)H dehydrogenase (quinone)